MMTVLEQRIFDGLRTADEQAAIKTVLFLGDPLAAPVPADEDDGRGRATRWRFDELHVGIPSSGEPRDPRSHDRIRRDVVVCADFADGCRWPGDGLTHAVNIFPAGYEFESGGIAIA